MSFVCDADDDNAVAPLLEGSELFKNCLCSSQCSIHGDKPSRAQSPTLSEQVFKQTFEVNVTARKWYEEVLQFRKSVFGESYSEKEERIHLKRLNKIRCVCRLLEPRLQIVRTFECNWSMRESTLDASHARTSQYTSNPCNRGVFHSTVLSTPQSPGFSFSQGENKLFLTYN